jgi:hypothetical protein
MSSGLQNSPSYECVGYASIDLKLFPVARYSLSCRISSSTRRATVLASATAYDVAAVHVANHLPIAPPHGHTSGERQ